MKKPTILLIDDEPAIRLLLTEILKDYLIVVANDGLKAMAWLSQGNKADLIITDISMPVFDGIRLIESLKCSTRFGDIPVIVLSASIEDEYQDKALRNGVFDFLPKPFDPLKLKLSVQNALNPIKIF